MKVRKKELVKLIETIIDKRLNEKTEISLVTKVSEAMAEGLVLDSIRD
jgi:hypothetical protein